MIANKVTFSKDDTEATELILTFDYGQFLNHLVELAEEGFEVVKTKRLDVGAIVLPNEEGDLAPYED